MTLYDHNKSCVSSLILDLTTSLTLDPTYFLCSHQLTDILLSSCQEICHFPMLLSFSQPSPFRTNPMTVQLLTSFPTPQLLLYHYSAFLTNSLLLYLVDILLHSLPLYDAEYLTKHACIMYDIIAYLAHYINHNVQDIESSLCVCTPKPVQPQYTSTSLPCLTFTTSFLVLRLLFSAHLIKSSVLVMSSSHHTTSWAEEQSQIYDALESPPRFAENPDPLGDVMEYISGVGMVVDYTHHHVDLALELLKDYPFPVDMKDFNMKFRFKEWVYVCESLLAARRLRLLEPNQFQRFLIGFYIWEYQPSCHCACGLTPGIWCGESLSFISVVNFSVD